MTAEGLTRSELLAELDDRGATDVDAGQDRPNSVSSAVVRCRLDGRLTVAVGSEATTETAIGSLLDVLDLHRALGPGDGDGVAVVVGQPEGSAAVQALGTLLAAVQEGPSVQVHRADTDGLHPVGAQPVDFSGSAKPADWLRLMDRLAPGPPELLQQVVHRVGRDDLRAYPMLTGHPDWSLRLEGLEVGRFRPGSGSLDVGKDGEGGRQSSARAAWTAAVGGPGAFTVTDDDAGVAEAARRLSAFAGQWVGSAPGRKPEQNEHALESRVLRGVCPVVVDGTPLDLIRPDDGLTNWGSQFPTQWSLGGRPRYLDALLRRGRVPWAVEMKIAGGTGVGGYYRHAVGQAVLYRHFIRSAEALSPWFERQDLDRTEVQAVVLVPEFGSHPRGAEWLRRLDALCAVFDVHLVQADPVHAVLR